MNFRLDLSFSRRGEPIDVARNKPLTYQFFLLSNHYPLRLIFDVNDIEPLRRRNSQSPALADRDAVNAGVPAEQFARSIDNIAAVKLLLIGIGSHQRLVIAETNVLTFGTVGDGQTEPSCLLSHITLLHFTKRKQRVCQLILAERKQKVRLILPSICAAEKRHSAILIASSDSRVVPCGNVVGPLLFRPVEQGAQFKIAIASYARIWRSSPQVFSRERFDDGLDELRP